MRAWLRATVEPHTMFKVSDTGAGIPSEIIDKIFDPFFTTKNVGLVFVRSLRRINPEAKIIVSTGRAELGELAEIAELNVEGFLAKPNTTRSCS